MISEIPSWELVWRRREWRLARAGQSWGPLWWGCSGIKSDWRLEEERPETQAENMEKERAGEKGSVPGGRGSAVQATRREWLRNGYVWIDNQRGAWVSWNEDRRAVVERDQGAGSLLLAMCFLSRPYRLLTATLSARSRVAAR